MLLSLTKDDFASYHTEKIMIIGHEISWLVSFSLKIINIFICPCLLFYGFHSMELNRPLFEHLLWTNQYAECLDIKIDYVGNGGYCLQLICMGWRKRKEGRHIETDPGKEKHNILSAVPGTWEGAIDHREKAAALSWGKQGRIHRGDDAFPITHDIPIGLVQLFPYSSHRNCFHFTWSWWSLFQFL